MTKPTTSNLRERVTATAEALLAQQDSVSALDLLVGLNWLFPGHAQMWERQYEAYRFLEPWLHGTPERRRLVLELFRQWGQAKGLAPVTTRIFPKCPRNEALAIARHACVRGSGRVGRTAGAKGLEPAYLELAVRAHVRHEHTNYDTLLLTCADRRQARQIVGERVDAVLRKWRGAAANDRSAATQ